MQSEETEQYLQAHGIRPTAVRILVWRKVSRKHQAFTLSDIEEMLPEMDRSSIFRALRLFTEQKLLHEIDDGSGSCKYCLCRCHEHDDEKDTHIHRGHVHFSCQRCGKTFCLEDQPIPQVNLPHGFVMEESEYIIKGVCPDCR